MLSFTFIRRASALVAYLVLSAAAAFGGTNAPYLYVVRHDRWTAQDDADYQSFIQGIGESDCDTLDACLHSAANPYRDTDQPGVHFASDCAELPYVLRFYYAWKRGLPFSYESGVAPAGGVKDDIRYSLQGNVVTTRTDVPPGVMTGYQIIDIIRGSVSSATYRIHPDHDSPLPPDHYSPRIDPKSILPGTIVYDPAGHVAIVFQVDPDGRIHTFDAHTDFSLTQMVFDVRFERVRPAQGAGFKNWRPLHLVGAVRQPDGTLKGGHIILARNDELPDYSVEQFYGNVSRPADDDWASGTFEVNGEQLDYYDFVRARMAGGKLEFDPIKEVRETAWSICADLRYRAVAVDLALRDGIAERSEPQRLPRNIYGTFGEWETYSSPSRDARLKTAFKVFRDNAQRFIEMNQRGDTRHLVYNGKDLAGDMLKAYDLSTQYCKIEYRKSDGSITAMSYEDARKRLFAMSFDPYQCPERRWGATGDELATCRDDATKEAWYKAEQNLRNQIDRTYEARMDFSLQELGTPGPGKGVPAPPDTDVRAYLQNIETQAKSKSGGWWFD